MPSLPLPPGFEVEQAEREPTMHMVARRVRIVLEGRRTAVLADTPVNKLGLPKLTISDDASTCFTQLLQHGG